MNNYVNVYNCKFINKLDRLGNKNIKIRITDTSFLSPLGLYFAFFTKIKIKVYKICNEY